MEFLSMEILGAWSIVFFTICIFSYLFGDNPFYKIAEHIFVGVSAGYIAVYTFWSTIWPNLFGRLWPASQTSDSILMKMWYAVYGIFSFIVGFVNESIFPKGGVDSGFELNITYVVPLILGIFMILRLVPSLSWLARFSIAYIVGMISGLKLYSFLNSNILMQVKDLGINTEASSWIIFNQLLIIIGVVSGLIYFFFSMEHKGFIGKVSKIGIFYLMIKFGASFGFAVMGRISLLIGRFEELIQYSSSEYYNATPVILIVIIISLTAWFMINQNKNNLNEEKVETEV
tara:strand:+ start:1004 stop:1864 length:861 start_codon:yes stop_codon:yes gene_type:complete